MKPLKFKPSDSDTQVRWQYSGSMYDPSIGCNKVISEESRDVDVISLETAQKLHDDWLIKFIEELMCYNTGASVLSEDVFKEIRDWYNE